MNFLGHIFFSQNNTELMYANLFGDFVKGKNLSRYRPIVQKGIRIHRNIDHYIDHHPITIELFHHLYPSLPKVTGIAVDLYFDHLLAKNWSNYSVVNFEEFLANFYQQPIDPEDYPNPSFHLMLSKMKASNWLLQYQTLEGLNKACMGVSQRISFENNLHEGVSVFVAHEAIIVQAFHDFMEKAIIHFSGLEL